MGCALGRGADRTPTGFFQALSPSATPWRLVLDTNVVLDLLHFADAAALPIQHAIEDHRARCYVSANTHAELSRVLTYPEFKLAASAQAAWLARYQSWFSDFQTIQATHRKLPRCSDPDDQMFLELAASIPADFLISKDKAVLALKHHALGFKILTPGEAAALFAANPPRLTSAHDVAVT